MSGHFFTQPQIHRPDFSIFHKPSHTDLVVHSSSFYPFTHKLAASRSMIHRPLSVLLREENYQKEYLIIKQMAINKGYDAQLIDKMIEKNLSSQSLKLAKFNSLPEPNKFRVLRYLVYPSEQIATKLRKFNIAVAFINIIVH